MKKKMLMAGITMALSFNVVADTKSDIEFVLSHSLKKGLTPQIIDTQQFGDNAHLYVFNTKEHPQKKGYVLQVGDYIGFLRMNSLSESINAIQHKSPDVEKHGETENKLSSKAATKDMDKVLTNPKLSFIPMGNPDADEAHTLRVFYSPTCPHCFRTFKSFLKNLDTINEKKLLVKWTPIARENTPDMKYGAIDLANQSLSIDEEHQTFEHTPFFPSNFNKENAQMDANTKFYDSIVNNTNDGVPLIYWVSNSKLQYHSGELNATGVSNLLKTIK